MEQIARRSTLFYLLDIQEREGDGLPEIVSVLAGDLKVLVQLFLDQRVVLHRDCVPHQIFLSSNEIFYFKTGISFTTATFL